MSLFKTVMFIAIAMVASFAGVAGAFSNAHLVEVVAVSPSYEEGGRTYRGVTTGAALGGSLGALANRGGDSRDRAAAAALGAAIGGAIGNRRDEDRRRIRGFDVIVRFEDGRHASVFLTEPPAVMVGETAFLVGGYGRGRLVPALSSTLGSPSPEPAVYRPRY